MLNYLQETLGFSASEQQWPLEKSLPQYLRNKRSYSILCIGSIQLLLIKIKESQFNIQTYLKHQEKLKQYWHKEIALCFDKLSPYQRKALIEQKLSFIVPESQLYIPSLGMIFQRKSPTVKQTIQKFTASTQHAFLFLLHHASLFPMKKSDLARYLSTNAMAITRAVQTLASLNLISVENRGRSDYIVPTVVGKELFERAKPFLINPVQKQVYVQPDTFTDALPICGEDALAQMSMLSPPAMRIKAIDKKAFKENTSLVLVDPAWQITQDYIKLEVWAYDPLSFSHDGIVDIVSLSASIKDNQDERIEEAIEEALEAHKW